MTTNTPALRTMPPPSLAVTTAVKPQPSLEARALGFARELGAPMVPRRNVTISRIFLESGASRLLVVAEDKLRLIDSATRSEYFYHPNMALVRGLNIVRGARDLFSEATGLGPGDSLLDCTVGFASEASLGALIVGSEGSVIGLESVPELALVTREGVASFPMQTKILQEAMRRVRIVCANYRDYLADAESKSVDVVYFDPFFSERLTGSENSVSPLAIFGNQDPLDETAVRRALHVARRRVVIKHPKYDEPLSESITAQISHVVTTRKNRLAYSVLDAIG